MTSSANGVTVPAIRKKIIVWSRRRIQRRTRGPLPVDPVIERADAEAAPRGWPRRSRRPAGPRPLASTIRPAPSDERDEERVLVGDAAQPRLDLRDLLGGRGLRRRRPSRRPPRVASATRSAAVAASAAVFRSAAARRGVGDALIEALARSTHRHQALVARRVGGAVSNHCVTTLYLASAQEGERYPLVEFGLDGMSRAASSRPASWRAAAPRTAPRCGGGASARPCGHRFTTFERARAASRSTSASATARASASTATKLARRSCARPTSDR